MVTMRRIVAASLLALSACGPVAAPSSGSAGGPDPASTPQTSTQIIGSGDGFHVSTASASRTVMHEIAAPVDRVWQVLPQVYRELGITGNADAATRTVASPSANYTRRMFGEPATRFFDCGRGQFGTEMASTHTISLTLHTTVQPGATPESARLETVANAYARNNDGANSTMTQCQSKGLLEGLIALRVREKLGAAAPARR
jgi:hypothetical protein